MSEPEFALGDRVKFSRNLVRRSLSEVDPRSNSGRTRYVRRWVPDNRVDEREGVIVGKRTIWDGERWLIGPDEGYSFAAETHQEAYLVATNLRQKPVYVAPDEIEATA